MTVARRRKGRRLAHCDRAAFLVPTAPAPKESPDRNRGSYRKAALIEKYGADVPLPDLLHMIGASCPKMDALGNDPCGAHYRGL